MDDEVEIRIQTPRASRGRPGFGAEESGPIPLIVPFRSSPSRLRALAAVLEHLSRAGVSVELVLVEVDVQPCERTSRMVERLVCPTQHLFLPTPGLVPKARAINCGFRATGGDVIAVLDADVLVAPWAWSRATAWCRRSRGMCRLFTSVVDLAAGEPALTLPWFPGPNAKQVREDRWRRRRSDGSTARSSRPRRSSSSWSRGSRGPRRAVTWAWPRACWAGGDRRRTHGCTDGLGAAVQRQGRLQDLHPPSLGRAHEKRALASRVVRRLARVRAAPLRAVDALEPASAVFTGTASLA